MYYASARMAKHFYEIPLFSVTVVLIECKYDIFRQLSLKELNYKVILPGDQIVTPATSEVYYNLQQRLKARQKEQENMQNQIQQLEEDPPTMAIKEED